MKILVTGARGMLGKDLMAVMSDSYSIDGVDIDEFDITDRTRCRDAIRSLLPDLVVHAAAFARVDACETERDTAMRVNAEGAGNVAEACNAIGAKIVYFSSDYIFDGLHTEPYTETDVPNPLSVYGKSKLEGEHRVSSLCPDRHLIIRTAWLFGLHGPNFIDTIIRLSGLQPELRVVDDQVGCPTSTVDLARATCELIDRNATGIVNVTNSGIASWYELAEYTLEHLGIATPVCPIKTSEFPRPAKRPAYSALSSRYRDGLLGKPLPLWKNAVDRFLESKLDVHPPKESVE